MNKVFLHVIAGIISLALILKFYYLTPQTYIFPYFAAPMRPFHAYDAYRYTSIILGFMSLFIVVVLGYRAKQFKDILKSIKSGLIAIIIAILFYGSFYIVQAKYTYEEHPQVFGYFSDDGKYIENKEKYFNLVKKYGSTAKGYKPFETLEDSIKALEYANINNFKGLYYNVFLDLDRFGYDKAFEKYQDKTFQVYFIYKLLSNRFSKNMNILYNEKYINNILLYKKHIKDDSIIKIIDDINSNYYLNKDSFDINNFSEFYDEKFNEMKKIEGVNWNIF